ncbi:delta-60 repeat domain-containing protein [Pseudofulvimonas gallinarii]|jgi:hypothetical protein|uniref:Beta-propeller uncharacterized protein DUF5122 n=1 Tax=Pseudofulvimonas gallinarii TaxID=634155 RepID=A0A4R3LEM8_9GAMM|nr:delta-60 repeat domain-containing protein [Pseudofulvimonas gallinarii]TCS98503.1 beta-propeller uncharacterized protein DUF5122 [Pseudofulvimonas gallinarii]THD13699.1 hypothetical protein B1808_06615 [Pseudofulvimonas gallinarii]
MSIHPVIGLVLRLACVCLLLGGTQVRAQAPAPFPLPDLDLRTNGQVHAMLLQPDLRLIIAGSFTQVNGVERHNIARLLPSGLLDPGWNPDLPGEGIYALARDSEGRIYAGGSFSGTGNPVRMNLVRIVGSGVVDSSWAPQPDGPVHALAVESGENPRVYAGGTFQEIGGLAQRYLARLDGTTAQTDLFWPAAGTDGPVYALLFAQDDTSIFIGGRFSTMAAHQRRFLARVDLNTGITRGWNAHIDIAGIDPMAVPGVYALAQSGSSLLVGGAFRQMDGLSRRGLGSVGTGDTAVVSSWAPQLVGEFDTEPEVRALGVDSNGGVIVAGQFASVASTTRNNIARVFLGSSAVDLQWDAGLDGAVHAVEPVAGTSVVFIGGRFENANGQLRMGHAALNHVGQPLDRVANLGGDAGQVYALARHADGGVVAGGEFNLVNGQHGRRNILKLLPNGNLDLAWSPRFNRPVLALAAAADGAVFAGGAFNRANDLMRMRLARITASGGIDPTWNQGAWGGSISPSQVNALALAHNGALYVGGHFTGIGPSMIIGNVPRNSLARLSTTGVGTADSWAPAVNEGSAAAGTVRSIAVSADGEWVFVGGLFTSVAGQNRSNIAKISSTGVLDGWHPAANGEVRALQLTGTSSIHVGGFFQSIGGQNRSYLARLSTNVEVVSNWNPAPNNPVLALARTSDGAVFAAGLFTQMGGQPRAGLARLLASIIDPVDMNWNAGVTGIPYALLAGTGDLHVGGYYFEVGGQPRLGLARLPAPLADRIFSDGFDPYI